MTEYVVIVQENAAEWLRAERAGDERADLDAILGARMKLVPMHTNRDSGRLSQYFKLIVEKGACGEDAVPDQVAEDNALTRLRELDFVEAAYKKPLLTPFTPQG